MIEHRANVGEGRRRVRERSLREEAFEQRAEGLEVRISADFARSMCQSDGAKEQQGR
ncbi:MAG TPA: hypothetical protein VJT73_11380 [Polyangiaceae bacterium]|nr:hypothetical protein [Polyangiaceae bacterium]